MANNNSPFSTKQKVLTDNETRQSLNRWIESLYFHISNEPRFCRFIDDLKEWQGSNVVNRGFVNDINDPPTGLKMTAANKAINLKVFLGFVSLHCPCISSSFVKDQAKSLDEIFQRLREFYDCRKSGGKITELLDFTLGPLESREALWERVYSYLEDSLITQSSGMLHLGEAVIHDELMTPTILNIGVVIWLNAIHRGLPSLVKQKFAIPLRNNTIFSLRTEISDSIPSLLDELGDRESNISYSKSRRGGDRGNKIRKGPECCLCKEAKRQGANTHFFQSCPFLPINDKKYLNSRVRDIEIESDSDSDEGCQNACCCQSKNQYVQVQNKQSEQITSVNARVDVISSPCMEIEVEGGKAEVILDTGAESNLIRGDEAKRLGLKIYPTSHKANMADGVSPMEVSGEVHFVATRCCSITDRPHSFRFDGLVVRDLNCSILAGMPFMGKNDVYLRPTANSVYVGDCCSFRYISIRRCTNVSAATILRVPRQVCLLPGDSLELPVPSHFREEFISVEPRALSDNNWVQCGIYRPEKGLVSLENVSSSPVIVRRHEQLCQVRPVGIVSNCGPSVAPSSPLKDVALDRSCDVVVDPSNIVAKEVREGFIQVNTKYRIVFSSSIGCYNGRSGNFNYKINMSSLPPQRKGRVPLYNRSNLEELQLKFDELYSQGVLVRPEDVNVTAEYVSPSFLVAKPSGGHRLVTAFTELGQFAKPQPSLISNVDEVIRSLGQFKWIVKADLSQAYYQVPLDKSSYRFVGVSTPYRGVYVYTRTVMGMPGSESALEQLLSRVLGDFIVSGSVIKLADDLYVGADSPESLLEVWEKVLHTLFENNLRLSPSKTVCCPMSTEVLGWIWKQGTLQASNHRLNTLSLCEPPKTVKSLRSFIGAYKFLSKVLPRHSDMMSPLDRACSGHDSKDVVVWSHDLLEAFNRAKEHLKDAKILTLPVRSDKLQIITDAASTQAGLSSTLYVIREGKAKLAGLFNARKTSSQEGWLACELEALGIAAGVKHFSPYIVQSSQVTDVLTDSKPCVQAYEKLSKGAFSASSRVTTFLSTISRFSVRLAHIPGSKNVVSDYGSRHALPCEGECQICKFVSELEVSVVKDISVTDILAGHCSIPFTTRSSWVQIQRNCSDLKHVYHLLKDGRVPSRKRKGLTDVRRYLRYCRLSSFPSDGLIVVDHSEPLGSTRQRIVVPRVVLDGLLTALHLQLSHPSKHQLKLVFNRAFYALDSEAALSRVSDSCHTCKSLQKVPSLFREQSTSVPPDRIGSWFSADVIKREGQLILLVRENVTSYSDAVFISSEAAESLKEGLACIINKLRPLAGTPICVRVDGATGFQALCKDRLLRSLNITLEVGEAKNSNRNPIAERGIEDFHAEVCRIKCEGGKLSVVELSLVVANLNCRVRESGRSAMELWTSRDMISGEGLSLDYVGLIRDKVNKRKAQHFPSAKYKGRGKVSEKAVCVNVGDTVYLIQDRDKTKGRPLYMIVEKGEDGFCFVQKFTKNQLRAKRYKVRVCDVIKCTPENNSQVAQSSGDSDTGIAFDIRKGLDLGGAISENNSLSSSHESDSSSVSDSAGEDIFQSPSQVESSDESVDPEGRRVDSQGMLPGKRPRRRRRRPAYLADYETETDAE